MYMYMYVCVQNVMYYGIIFQLVCSSRWTDTLLSPMACLCYPTCLDSAHFIYLHL